MLSSRFLVAAALTLAFALPAIPTAMAAGQDGTCTLPNSDTTPPFEDHCYHQGVWFSPDTASLDVLIFPPQSPWELREWQLAETSVANWEAGVKAMGAPWLASGLHINDYTLGREPVPASALADPEVLVLLHSNALPLGMYAGAATQSPGVCHGQQLPVDPTAASDWHSHDGQTGTYTMACNGGGRVCVVTDAATLGTPSDPDRRVNFDLLSHEIGHCLSLGHVGDADTESTDDSVAYPEHDIMSYENDGLHAATMHCPSNLNIRVLEKAYGALLGQPGATTAIAPSAAGYVNMQPSDWNAPACYQSTAAITDTAFLTSADPAGLNAAPDADGDGVPDADDVCPGSDDRIDADGDGMADGCDADDNDGPAGDLDGDGVANAADQCPGIDDASPACQGLGGRTFYFGRGAQGSTSGNLDAAYGTLVLNEAAPTWTDPAVILVPGVDGTDAHNLVYEPGEWATQSDAALDGADVDVYWWGAAPATGGLYYPVWDVSLFFDGAAVPVATTTVTTDELLGSVPIEYHARLPAITGSGILSVVVDPVDSLQFQDFLVFYDGAAYPSRMVVGADPVRDSDGDGVNDDDDACPGFDDAADLDADGTPDGCDLDVDGDGASNAVDNCPTPNADQADLDGDGLGDACDEDADGDGVTNASDACPGFDDAADADGDGVADGCDADDTDGPAGDADGDGVANAADAFPNDPTESADADGDGVGDNADSCPGSDDAADLDGDGTPDGCDADRDGDGYSNDDEVAAGSDPDDASSVPAPTTTECLKPNGKPGKCKEHGANASLRLPVAGRLQSILEFLLG